VRPNDLLKLLKDVPFRPFRVVMNDGTVHEVRHQELVQVGRSTWEYTFIPTPDGLAERFDILSFLLISRIEIAVLKRASSNGG
jgi:hypothetical protein